MLAEPVATCIHAFRLSPLGAAGNRGRARRRDDRHADVHRRPPARRRTARRQRVGRRAPRLGRSDRGRGGPSGRARDTRLGLWRRASSSSTRSAPTRLGPRRSRSCSPAAARSGSACTTWRPRSRRSTSSCASSRSAARSPTPTPTSRRAVELLAEHPRGVRGADEDVLARGRRRAVRRAPRGRDERVRQGVTGAGRSTMRFDLLIRGGEVVDPGGGHEGRLDVAIERDRIAAVDREIPAESAFRVIDATGQIVTPGLVDLHTHVFHKLTYWGIDPDPVASRSGVTTWNDAGSVGALTRRGVPRLRRPAGAGRDHRVRQHLEHRPRLRRLRVRQPVVPRRRPVPSHGRPQPRPRARREGANGQHPARSSATRSSRCGARDRRPTSASCR